jgi:replication factor A1
MYTIPLNVIIEKIKAEKGMSVDEINKLVSKKMTELAGLVSADGAAHIVANELGVSVFSEEPQELKIKDISSYMKHIKVSGKIIAIFDLVEFKKDSNPGKVRNAIIGDETGRLKVSFWHHATEPLEKTKPGDILRLSNVASKENNGAIELTVSTPDAIEINPSGVSIEKIAEMQSPKKKIVEIQNDSAVTLTGVIVQSFKPNFYPVCPECRKKITNNECQVHGAQTPAVGFVLNVVLDDGTDTIRCVFFNDSATKLTKKSMDDFSTIKDSDADLEVLRKQLIGTLVTLSGSVRTNLVMNQKELIVSSIEL